MRPHPALLFILSLLLALALPGLALAQKETNVWYFGNKDGLDFNFSPPRPLTNSAMRASEGCASIADAAGNLLFYTKGDTVWNRSHAVMANGTGLAGHFSSRQGVVIVPQPGSKTRYFVFTSDAKENGFAKGFRYSVVDLARQGGLGEVTSKNILLHQLGEENITAVGCCSCAGEQQYWVAADRHDRPGHLYVYRVGREGVHPVPVVSLFQEVGEINFLKFSPAGDRIAFTGFVKAAASQPVIGIADFDLATGQALNLKLFPSPDSLFHRAIEFSGNGRMLYYTSGYRIRLVQYDLTQPTAELIARSAVVLADRENVSGLRSPQLASDGKIYVDGNRGLAVIEHPNVLGPGCGFQPIAIPGLGALMLPNFVTSFLYRNDTLLLNLEAGPDRRVCGQEPVGLGGRSSPALSYRWSPGAFLSDSTSPTPTFRYPGPVEKELTLQYVLTASDGPCSRRDTVQVTVYPLPQATLTGTRSVCPRVQGVEYRVEEPVEGHAYRWQVGGGTISSGQGTATITVNWGPTNAQAWVEAVPVSGQGCQGPPARLPVRVNVELIPETPRGPDAVCVNLPQGVAYSVTHTPGSIYTWGVEGGTLAAGQGTSRVTVDWAEEGRHKLWLQEQSTTRDTVCFGVSEPLLVSVYQDRTRLELAYVSVSLQDGRAVEAHWGSTDPARLSGPLLLYRRRKGESGWQTAASLPRGSTSHADPGLRTDEEVYEYRVEGLNGCDELIASATHATILLQGEGREQDGRITLSWNGYEGWEQGVERYEVWRRLDGQEKLRPVGQVNGNTLTYAGASGLDGFDHRFRV